MYKNARTQRYWERNNPDLNLPPDELPLLREMPRSELARAGALLARFDATPRLRSSASCATIAASIIEAALLDWMGFADDAIEARVRAVNDAEMNCPPHEEAY